MVKVKMIEVNCPICGRIISCKIDEAKGEQKTFVATMEFAANALEHYQRHNAFEIWKYYWMNMVEQAKKKLEEKRGKS